MKKFKEQKGAITVLVIVTVLFITMFLVTAYWILSNKLKIQKETVNEMRMLYETDVSMESIYDSYFAKGEIIPIYSYEQLKEIGSGRQISIVEEKGKIYTFSEDGTYVLMNDLNIEIEEFNISFLDKFNFEYNNNLLIINGISYPRKETGLLPNEYQQIEYIESTGEQWIYTEVNQRVGKKISYEIDFEPSALGGYMGGNGHTQIYMKDANFVIGERTKAKVEYDGEGSSLYINGVNKQYVSYGSNYDNYLIYLFTLGSNTGAYSSLSAPGKLYGCIMNDEIGIIRNFIPCYRKSDGKIGMYDLTNTGKNLFNKNEAVKSKLILQDASERYQENTSITGYIPVEAGSTYTFSGIKNIRTTVGRNGYFYSKDKIPLIPIPNDEYTVIVPQDAYYVRWVYYTEDENTAQFEKGSTATEYENFPFYTNQGTGEFLIDTEI